MRKRFQFKLWYYPFAGLIVGFIAAALIVESFTATWQYLGSPPEKIDRIIGISEGNRLYVITTSGDIYSLSYQKYLGQDRSSFINSLSHRVPPEAWTKENIRSVEPYPAKALSWDFFTWPVLFKVKQNYDIPLLFTEGSSIYRFALSEDGNLWGWHFGQGGMAVILYIIFPVIGLILGVVMVIGTLIERFFRNKYPPST